MPVLRFIGICLVGLLFLGSHFSSTLIKVHYWVNFDYISTELCVNRDMPELQCHGKCVLGQKLKIATENKRKSHPAHSSEDLQQFVVWMLPAEVESTNHLPVASFEQGRLVRAHERTGFPTTLFRPPVA